MAIRYRADRKSNPWQVYYNNPHTGKRVTLSFPTKKEAEKENSIISHNLKFNRDFFEKGEEIEEITGLTLEQLFLKYLQYKQYNEKALRWTMTCLRIPLQLLGQKSVDNIITKDLLNVLEALKAKGTKLITVRTRASMLRAVLKWGEAQEYCNYIRFPKLPQAYPEKFVPPTTEELQKMLAVAPTHLQRVIIIGSQLGLRIGESELFNIQWADVDLKRKVMRVHGAKKNKSQLWREVPIRENLLPLFEEWRAEDNSKGYIVNYKGNHINSIKTAWATLLKNAGITRRIRPYDLRHYFATYLIENGSDVGTVSKLMGHSTATMVLKHYQHVLDNQKRNAVEALPNLFNL